jgi:hypothetical protein
MRISLGHHRGPLVHIYVPTILRTVSRIADVFAGRICPHSYPHWSLLRAHLHSSNPFDLASAIPIASPLAKVRQLEAGEVCPPVSGCALATPPIGFGGGGQSMPFTYHWNVLLLPFARQHSKHIRRHEWAAHWDWHRHDIGHPSPFGIAIGRLDCASFGQTASTVTKRGRRDWLADSRAM